MERICLTFASGVGPSLLGVSSMLFGIETEYRNGHVSIEYPVQILFAFLRSSWAASYFSEKLWLPFHAFVCPFCGLFALSVLDFGLFLGSEGVISVFNR